MSEFLAAGREGRTKAGSKWTEGGTTRVPSNGQERSDLPTIVEPLITCTHDRSEYIRHGMPTGTVELSGLNFSFFSSNGFEEQSTEETDWNSRFLVSRSVNYEQVSR